MLTILTYHSIDNLGLVTSTTPDRFAAQMAFLAKHRFRILTMGEVVNLLTSDKQAPPRCAALTFDDGYRSVYTVALEHLRRQSFPATVFMTSGYLGKLSNWPSHAPDFATREMLTGAELRELSASGFSIGAHTSSHPHLTNLPPAQAQREIEDSRSELEQILGDRVRHFSYPYGERNDALRDFVAAHFDSACGAEMRLAGKADDIYDLPRIDAYYFDELMMLGGPQARTGRAYLRVRAGLRGMRRGLMREEDWRH